MRWNLSWLVIKDVALTGTAIWLIITQVRSPHPSDILLATAVVLTGVGAAPHARTLLSAPIAGVHSQQREPPSSPPSAPPSPPEVTHE